MAGTMPWRVRSCRHAPGIPEPTRAHVHIVAFNDLDSLELVLRKHPVACVLTEPVLQNIGVVLPRPGYLAGLRRLCDQHGSLLVFDEVKTGFRSAPGGYQELAGIRPDLSVFGKAIANGYPLGVIGGRRELMQRFADPDPARRVLIAGTYNAHPMSCAAAIATLKRLHADGGAVYHQLEARAQQLEDGLNDCFAEAGVAATHVRNGSAHCTYFCEGAPYDWHDILERHDDDFDRRYREALIAHGIYHFPAPCKQGSISAAHSDEDISRTLAATRSVLRAL